MSKVVELAAGDLVGEPISIERFHACIAGHCADALSMHARHRATSPLGAADASEAQIRRQRDAILALDGDSVPRIVSWWEEAAESADPWKTWTACFLVASVATHGATEPILHVLSQIHEEDDERWAHAAEALALVPLSQPVDLGHDLLASSSAAARAVGIDLLSRRGALSPVATKASLRAREPVVAASAARSVTRTGAAPALVDELLATMRAHDATTAAWEAARALTLAGIRAPYLEIQGGGPLAASLGVRAVEILVMAGADTDIDVFELLLAGAPMTPPLLSAIARFGNVTTWSFLAHYLTEPELAGAAVEALRTLFGDLVPAAEATTFAAWKRAIAEAEFTPSMRYRRGNPWHPSTVLAELATGTLPRLEVARRVDELAARTGFQAHVDLGAWHPDVQAALTSFAAGVGARHGQGPPGAWR
ncbi:hypothetical protein A7982_13263 [Minicystis rosea]|nr:hypothetical protein A7982_13263 [Minicystis rosea]